VKSVRYENKIKLKTVLSGLKTISKTLHLYLPQRPKLYNNTFWNNNKWQWLMKLECGPMPNLMADLPNVGGALCWTPQTLADAHYSTAVQ